MNNKTPKRREDETPRREKDLARLGLGATGFATLATGMVATFMREPATADAAMVVAGIGVAALAILLPRVRYFEVTKEGVKAELTVGEEDAQQGRRFPAEQGVKAVLALSSGQLTGDAVAVPPGIVIPPNISVTSEAIGALTRLSGDELTAVGATLPTLNGKDARAVEGGSGGRSYFVRFIHNNLRICYRMLDKSSPSDPEKWVVIAIETDHEAPPGRPCG